MIRRFLPMSLLALLSACASPQGIAQPAKPTPAVSDTVQAALDNGLVMRTPAGKFDFLYLPDGSLGGSLGLAGGWWKAEGARICINVPGFAENQCLTYPDGKKPGDTFTIEGGGGPITIEINRPD